MREAAENWNNLGISGAPSVIFEEDDEFQNFTVQLVNYPDSPIFASAGALGFLINTSNFNTNILTNSQTPMDISAHDLAVSTSMHELGHFLGLTDLYMYETSASDRNNYYVENGVSHDYLNSSGNKINNRNNLMYGWGAHQDITVNKNPNGSLRYVSDNDIYGVRKAQGWDLGIQSFSLGFSSTASSGGVKLYMPDNSRAADETE